MTGYGLIILFDLLKTTNQMNNEGRDDLLKMVPEVIMEAYEKEDVDAVQTPLDFIRRISSEHNLVSPFKENIIILCNQILSKWTFMKCPRKTLAKEILTNLKALDIQMTLS
uniref:Uncharacterized protein n=1 Tax=Pristionchus pacificus TaxID=54126 RepID=A0A2A6BYC3_PRIPA|eukprot:PDM70817.1 hypothetical protein PRIPAC_45021 [Pristionchus pacificus]